MRDQQTTAWDDKLRPGLAAYFCKVVLAQNHAHVFTAAFTLQKQSWETLSETCGTQSLKYLLPSPLRKSLPTSAVDNSNFNLIPLGILRHLSLFYHSDHDYLISTIKVGFPENTLTGCTTCQNCTILGY